MSETLARFQSHPIVVHDLGGNGPAVVICHATGLCGLAYLPLSDELTRYCRVWAVDFRGHGAAGSPVDDDFSYASMAADLAAVIDALELDAVMLFGHSMGGAIALLAAKLRPNVVRAAYVYEPAVMDDDAAMRSRAQEFAQGVRRRREVFPSRAAALAGFACKPPFERLRADALSRFIEHGTELLPDGSVRLRCRAEDEARCYKANATIGPEDFRGLDVPVTVACGGGDEFGTGLVPSPVLRTLPHARVVAHEHLGHFGPLEAPTAIAHDALATFLAEGRGAPAHRAGAINVRR